MKVAISPYTYGSNEGIPMIQHMIGQHCEIVNYYAVKKSNMEDVDVIYFNWIEEGLDDEDKRIINCFRKNNKKVIWVFHNRLSHRWWMSHQSYENIKYMAKNASDIIVLSLKSIDFLYEYNPQLSRDKVHFVPHPHYIGNYGSLVRNCVKEALKEERFTFGSIGFLRRDKNADLLIRAFKEFKYKKECRLLIAGQPESDEYLKELLELSEHEDNIIIIPEQVRDYSVSYLIQASDVIMMPYDCNSCMNSGVMILAFSNKRTVITSNIAMAEEYDAHLIYKYDYDESSHIKSLTLQMEKAFIDGKKIVHEKGARLYCDVEEHNSRELVKNKLSSVIGFQESSGGEVTLSDEYLIRKNMYALEHLVSDFVNKELINTLKDNPEIKLGLYGYGKYGRLVFQELTNEGIHVSCIVDENKELENKVPGVDVCSLDNLHMTLDYMIVTTARADVWYIREKMEKINSSCYVFGLNDI